MCCDLHWSGPEPSGFAQWFPKTVFYKETDGVLVHLYNNNHKSHVSHYTNETAGRVIATRRSLVSAWRCQGLSAGLTSDRCVMRIDEDSMFLFSFIFSFGVSHHV